MEKSYWYLQRCEEINVAKREVAELEEKIVKTLLTPDDVHAFEEREAIEHILAHAQNAKKKAAQRALEAWRQKYSGSKWDIAAKAYPNYKKNLSDLQNHKHYIRDLEAYKETIEPIVAFLTARGFLSEGSLTKESLTERGVLATEINEGHPILMTELYLSGLCADLTQEELIAVLACFMVGRQERYTAGPEKLAILRG